MDDRKTNGPAMEVWNRLVRAAIEASPQDRAAAIRKVVRDHPAAHQAMLEEVNQNARRR